MKETKLPFFKTARGWKKFAGRLVKANGKLQEENEKLAEKAAVLDAGSQYIARPKQHHAIIEEDQFAVEHPLSCDLKNCDWFTEARNAWEEPPAEPGRYLLMRDPIELFEEEPYTIYWVKECPPTWPGVILEDES